MSERNGLRDQLEGRAWLCRGAARALSGRSGLRAAHRCAVDVGGGDRGPRDRKPLHGVDRPSGRDGDRGCPRAARGYGDKRGVGKPMVRRPRGLLLPTASFEVLLLVVDPESSSNLGNPYIALIAVNCLVLARLETVSSAASIAQTLARSLRGGLAFAGCLVLVTLVREVLGAGTITLFPIDGFSGTIIIPSLSADPARALGLAGEGSFLRLGYLAAAGARGAWRQGMSWVGIIVTFALVDR